MCGFHVQVSQNIKLQRQIKIIRNILGAVFEVERRVFWRKRDVSEEHIVFFRAEK
jgi:hypothetical protein